MDTPHAIDSLDEVLRILYLESAKNLCDSTERQLPFVLSANLAMSDAKRTLLLQRLGSVMMSLSLGQLLSQSMSGVNFSEELVMEKIPLPAEIIKALKEDTIYTNSIPIIIFKNLLNMLNLSYSTVESAVRKTFDMLQHQVSSLPGAVSGINVAYRKGHFSTSDSFLPDKGRIEGKELFENKEALDKYLTRLSELMHQ